MNILKIVLETCVACVSEPCEASGNMEDMIGRCTHSYFHTFPPLDNNDYLPHWISPDNISEIDRDSTGRELSFLYSTADDINGAPIWAHLSVLDGGGYVSVLGTQIREANIVVDGLMKSNWVDQYTRAVLVEFSLINVNSNLFTMVTLAFEFPPYGGVFRFHAFETIKLYRYIGAAGVLLLLLECLSFLFFITVLYKIIKRCITEGKEFVLSLWGVSYFIMSIAFLGAVSMYTLRSVWTESSLEEVMNNRGKLFNMYTNFVADVIFFPLGIFKFSSSQ